MMYITRKKKNVHLTDIRIILIYCCKQLLFIALNNPLTDYFVFSERMYVEMVKKIYNVIVFKKLK